VNVCLRVAAVNITLSSQASADVVSDETAASSSCSLSPQSKQSTDKDDEILIDFTTPEPSHTSPLLCDVAVADDGEILFVGPNFTGTWSFLDGGTFGEFPFPMGIQSSTVTNPFLANFLASSNSPGEQASVTNGVGLPAVNDHTITSDELPAVTEYYPAAGIRRSPLVGKDAFAPSDQSEVRSISPRSPRSLETTSRVSSEMITNDSMHLRPLTVSISPSFSPIICETNIDNPTSSPSSTSPVTFVVSSQHVVLFSDGLRLDICRMDCRMLYLHRLACLDELFFYLVNLLTN